MNKSGLIALIVGGFALSIIVTLAFDAQSATGFEFAKIQAERGVKRNFMIVGSLKKNLFGEPEMLQYNPTLNPDYCTFLMLDQDNIVEQVHYYQAKPRDFEKTNEKFTVEGQYKDGKFVASKVLVKCPSKYNQEGQL